MTLFQEGQVMVRGLVMGPGTDYEVTNFNPWKSLVKAPYTGSNPYSDGGWSGPEFREPVQIPLHIHILASTPSEWWELHTKLLHALRPIRTETVEPEIHWRNGGQDFMMFARPRSIDPEVQNMSSGAVTTSCSLLALDPSIYSGGENGLHSVELGLYRTVDGLSAPFGLPTFIRTVVADGETVLINEGITPSQIHIRINGPVDTPTFSVRSEEYDNSTLWFDLTLIDGEWLDVYTEDMEVIQNGFTTRLAAAKGTFPMAYPDETTIRYTSADYNELTTASISHRYRW